MQQEYVRTTPTYDVGKAKAVTLYGQWAERRKVQLNGPQVDDPVRITG